MFVLPGANAVTTPVLEFIVATSVLLLDHVPPGSPLVARFNVPFTQVELKPLIVPATGAGTTVTTNGVEAV